MGNDDDQVQNDDPMEEESPDFDAGDSDEEVDML